MDVINEGDDLACALLSASYLDVALTSLLGGFLIQSEVATTLLDSGGALGSLSARSDAAYCLGLISKPLYQNARAIGRVRNLFAHHHLSLRFDDERVADLLHALILPSLAPGPDGHVDNAPVSRMASSSPRSHYVIMASSTVLLILRLASEREQRRTSSQVW